jgi:hypothetical protein
LRRACRSGAIGRIILSRNERKARVRTSIWEDAERGYEGMDDEFFPFCLVGEEFRCVLGVRYKEDKTESVWSGSKTYTCHKRLHKGITRQQAHPFDIWENLVPEEAPKLNYSTYELVFLHVREFSVEGIHSRANKLRGLVLKSGDRPGWGVGHNALYVALDELVQVLSGLVHMSIRDAKVKVKMHVHRYSQVFTIEKG